MTDDRFALQVQCLATATQKTHVLAALVASRVADGVFTSAAVREAFLALDVPPPGNVPRELARLADAGFALQRGGGKWTLTPTGRAELPTLVGRTASQLATVSASVPHAEFAHVEHTVIPAWAAPPRWQVGIKRFLERFPFEANLFVMTRFGSEGDASDPVNVAVEAIREVSKKFGLTTHLASDHKFEDDLLGNIGAYMWGCQYGIGIVEDLAERGINHNAVIELGGMIVTGRRCAVLKDKSVASLPTDLSGQIYQSIDLADEATVVAAVESWFSDDLGRSQA